MIPDSPRRAAARALPLIVLGLLPSGLATAVAAGPAPEAPPAGTAPDAAAKRIFARENLIAWCIVPFDSRKRGPEDRAAMLQRLGFTKFAYDWRGEHIPTFDAEIEALTRHGVALDAFWVAPGELNRESRLILDVLKRHGVKAQLWALLDLGPDKVAGAEQARRVKLAADKLGPLALAAKEVGCTVGLYNHGGWFGEPENQLAIVEDLQHRGITNVGLVYNLHHGHAHLSRLPALLKEMKPHLLALNLNGMDRDGEAHGRKILPLGQGELDLELLRTIQESGYHGPIGILGHTMDDAEDRLRDNLDGLDWLVPQLAGKPPGPRPRPRTPVPPPPRPATDTPASPKAAAPSPAPSITPASSLSPAESKQVTALIAAAKADGDPDRGARVFVDARFACSSCHKVGRIGGEVGPDLSTAGLCIPPEQVVASVLWPRKTIKEGYEAIAVARNDGTVVQGYKQAQAEAGDTLTLSEAATGRKIRIARAEIDEVRAVGTLMPDGLAETMTPAQRRDLVAFLLTLGRSPGSAESLRPHVAHAPAEFAYDRAPLVPAHWPSWQHRVNRDRIYDFYAKEAESFSAKAEVPPLLPPFPGLDGGRLGHWGNQDETTWTDDRWNRTDHGTLLSGIFRGAGVTVPKGICVRLGDRGEVAACFNPETLTYDAAWRGGFVKFSSTRHGFLDGLLLDGTPLPKPPGARPETPFTYHGVYRHGRRVIFSYRIGEAEMLDAPWVDEEGRFTRTVAPAREHPLAGLIKGGPPQWPAELATRVRRGTTRPYAVDTIELPTDNPWRALFFIGDHDFFPDGTAMLCTMQGDVWRVEGLGRGGESLRWRRFASGLHHALGLVIADGRVHVLGRDRITRLHDLNGDGEADYYESASSAYETSPAGHDFICGLQRDAAGRFYTVSGKQGLLRISADGTRAEVLATGFRNPDGLALTPDGTVTVPCSEGEWTPSSMICEVRPGGHYGYGGPGPGKVPDLPLVYLPRGLDNSSGGQVAVAGNRWGPLEGRMIHLSFGAGTAFLLLRERVDGQAQGAVVPLPFEFLSGAHRGRFNPDDGQLYVSGMKGWGTYTVADGCFQRVRYDGDPVQLPVDFHARRNGVLVTFSRPLDPSAAEHARSHFAQVWNYRYSAAYGSPELSTRHPGMPGHDPLEVRSARVLADGRTLFLELPDLQPVNQLHLHLRVDSGPPHDLFATVHALGAPQEGIPGDRSASKVIAAHPILSDLAIGTVVVPNPWRGKLPNARAITVETGSNLTFATPTLTAAAGEPIALTLVNPDVVPHNWALIRPGTLPKVGALVNAMIAEPDALSRQYVPRTDDVLAYTDLTYPQDRSIIYFRAPKAPGHYPFLCTFPGHWMVMNGVLIVH